MSKLNLHPKQVEILRNLFREYIPDGEVWAYGSRVNGGGHEASDLDLVVRNPKNLDRSLNSIPRLQEAIRESNLPILVDILDWARMPESMHREIEKAHIVLQTPGE